MVSYRYLVFKNNDVLRTWWQFQRWPLNNSQFHSESEVSEELDVYRLGSVLLLIAITRVTIRENEHKIVLFLVKYKMKIDFQ